MDFDTANEGQPESAGVKRRGLLRFGTLITAFTGASAISAIVASGAEAGPADKAPSTAYIPTSEKGAPLGVATLNKEAKIPPGLLPDLSATFGQGVSVMEPRFGAKADGITDDGPAIRAAVAAGAGGRVFFPAGTYYYKAKSALVLPAKTVLEGVPGATIINFDTATSGTYTEFARNGGDSVVLQGLIINRASDFPSVLFPIQNYKGLTFKNCAVNGNRDVYTSYCHVWQIGVQNGGTFDGLLVESTTIRKCSYGLFQTNSSTGIARNLTISKCTFANNYATDLEFNAPITDNYNVSVLDCTFYSNQATTVGAGFGVGLAHITGAAIRGNTFSDYNNEAIHIEDYSTGIVVDGNSFKRCGMLFAAYVRVISGARYVKITNNYFDATANTNFIPVIQSVAGGVGNTPGGRISIDPFRLVIEGNQIQAGGCHGIYLSAAGNSTVIGNTLFGSSHVTAGVFGGGNGGYAIELWDGYGISVSGNTIRGFESALNRRTGTISTGGNGLTVTGNTVQHCNYGVAVVNPGSCVISGNIASECIHPMIVGQAAGKARPAVITGNHAIDCKFPMEIAGKLIVVTNGAAAVGTAQTLTIRSLGLKVPSGQAITFSGGGTLTLTATAAAGATWLTGTVGRAPIASGETGIVTGLPHSTSAADNHVTVIGNGDSVAGTY